MRRFQRSLDVVWRLHDGRVLVRRTTLPTAGSSELPVDGDASDLVGAAARVWVAAEVPSTPLELSAEAGVDLDATEQAVDVLLAAGWLVEARP